MAVKSNIVYFVADQLRADALAHLGNQASITPNLDQLSQEGYHFHMRIVKIQFVYLLV